MYNVCDHLDLFGGKCFDFNKSSDLFPHFYLS